MNNVLKICAGIFVVGHRSYNVNYYITGEIGVGVPWGLWSCKLTPHHLLHQSGYLVFRSHSLVRKVPEAANWN